jgi:hypothetical protein
MVRPIRCLLERRILNGWGCGTLVLDTEAGHDNWKEAAYEKTGQ